jgi:HK97 gp10 family phage protein
MPELRLNTSQVAKVLRGTPELLRSVARGDINASLAVANLFVTGMKEAIRSPKTGRVYTHEFRMIYVGGASRSGFKSLRAVPIKPRPPHQASAPGEPPASDTGTLINALGVEATRVNQDSASAGVGISGVAPYWEDLEYGTVLMEPRPFVRPVYEAGKDEALTAMIKKYRARTKARLKKKRGTRIGR